MGNFRPRTFTEYLLILWRRKVLFSLVTLAVFIATYAAISKIPDVYQSSATVVVASKQEDRSAIASRVATITEKLNSRSFLQPLIERHNLYPNEMGRGAIEAAIGRMRKDIKLDAKYRGDNPEMLTITYRSADPAVAKEVATDLVSKFSNMNQAMEQEIADQSGQVSSEISELEGRLSQLGQQSAIASAHSRAASQMRGDFNASRAQRVAAESSMETLSDKQFALQQQIAEQQNQIAEQEKLVKSAPRDVRSGSSYGVLLVRKAELEAQLKDYTAQYTEKNPKVVQAQNQISEINRQIAQLSSGGEQEGAAHDSAEARELRGLRRELANKQTELAIVQRELERKKQVLSSTPAVGSTSAPVATDAPIANISKETDTQRLRERYTFLLRKQDALQQSRIAAAGLDPGIFQIIDQPAQPQSPSGPDRFRLQLIGLALALALGLAVAVAAEAPRLFEVRTGRDVEYYLGAPVIALIPESLTPFERGRSRSLMLARRIAMTALLLALVPGLIFLLNHFRIFQVLANRW
jgi:protein tyrosine kinase modulator